jgi:predicted transcriptional regulator
MATSVKLDDPMKLRVQSLAQRRQRSPHWVMREAMRQYVEREEARESFREEAMAAWAEYRQTGRHPTGAEVLAALETWGTDAEAALPECHD